MALLWCDGFDYIDQTLNNNTIATQITRVKTHRNNSASSGPLNFNNVPGRGGRGGAIQWNDTGAYFRSPALGNTGVQREFILGFAYKPLTNFVNNNIWLHLYSGDRIQCSFRYVTSTNQVQFWRSNNAFLENSPANLFDIDVWQYIEMKIWVDDVNGMVTMRKNGIVVWESGIYDNRNTSGDNYWDNFRLDPCRFGNDALVDDLYVCDNTGTTNNDFLGDIAVDTIIPTADGDFTAWSKNAVGDHYEMLIDEYPYAVDPTDTQYVETNVINEAEMFHFQNLPTTVAETTKVYGVSSSPFVKCSDGTNPPTMVNVARAKDQEALSTQNFNTFGRIDLFPESFKLKVRTEDQYFAEGNIFETEPRNGLPWTIKDVNDAQFGVRYLG